MIESNWKKHGLLKEEYDRVVSLMEREPNDLELALFGVMWSEHCSYKNSKAQLRKFPTEGPQVLQGPGENAGVVDVGDGMGIAFKLESHNHPSAIAPFEGAATGVGGVMRDIFAMGARPIAATNSLRLGELKEENTQWLLRGAVAGIADYGSTVEVPTVAGDLYFHPSYQGNPLVNAMVVGFLKDGKIYKGSASGIGNQVLVLGTPTDRAGVGGASFSSAELGEGDKEKTHNIPAAYPEMGKVLIEACLEIMDKNAVVGLQDLGAAGLTSSGSEMAGRAGSGLYIDLEKVPLGDPTMDPREIMLSETQERMLMVVEPQKLEEVVAICEKWNVPFGIIGEVIDSGKFEVRKGNEILASVSADFLSDQAPVNIREWKEPAYFAEKKKMDVSPLQNYAKWTELLEKLLGAPNIASRAWVYEQLQTKSQLDILVGAGSDAAVFKLPDSDKGVALSNDCNSRYVYLDPWRGGAIAVAEAARNVACSGAKPLAITNCLNFGNPENPEIYWQFVQATDGIAEACRQLNTPVTGGNVSFNNEFDGEAIYPTPTIGMVGNLENAKNCLESSFKKAGDAIFLVGETLEELGASEALTIVTGKDGGEVPYIDFIKEKALHEFLYEAASKKLLESAHDCSDGGFAVALAESAIQGNSGVKAWWNGSISTAAMLFGESQSRAIISAKPEKVAEVQSLAEKYELPFLFVGEVVEEEWFSLNYNGEDVIDSSILKLSQIWRESLPCQLK